jgi:hypothetical protein
VAWNVVGIYGFVRDGDPRLIVPLIPVVLPAIFLVFNLMAFKLQFSVFGALQRTSFPEGEPLQSSRGTSGMIGLLHATAPFFSWHIFREGLAFNALGVGKGFIPTRYIQRTQKRFFGGFTVWHESPEVRSPLVIPSSSLHQALQQLLGGATQPS